MSEHTKGEWKFNGRDIVVGQNIGQQQICTIIEHRDEHKTEDEANARLIAAAPDLLAACEEMSKYFNFPGELNTTGTQIIERAKAAIAKAAK